MSPSTSRRALACGRCGASPDEAVDGAGDEVGELSQRGLFSQAVSFVDNSSCRHLGIDDLRNKRFDTIVRGRAGYDLALTEGLTSPYAHLRGYPIVQGAGMPMFDSGFDVRGFALESVRAFGNGALVRTYSRER
ncbi:hypothetical protein AB0D65_17525 [Streptomyces griseoloalbus]|uniref:Uncharacterized protein n=1 Tax=Streptomyces griseoloalbus TaxID=67303 RepID=A0ABV3E7V4_9ACTN